MRSVPVFVFPARKISAAPAAVVDLDVPPLQGQELTHATTCRKGPDDQRSQMGGRRRNEPFFLTWLKAPGAHCLCRPVESDDIDAMSLERRVVSVALRDGPVEELSRPCLESIQRNVPAFRAPTRRRGRPT
jgi:hypothetical protein